MAGRGDGEGMVEGRVEGWWRGWYSTVLVEIGRCAGIGAGGGLWLVLGRGAVTW